MLAGRVLAISTVLHALLTAADLHQVHSVTASQDVWSAYVHASFYPKKAYSLSIYDSFLRFLCNLQMFFLIIPLLLTFSITLWISLNWNPVAIVRITKTPKAIFDLQSKHLVKLDFWNLIDLSPHLPKMITMSDIKKLKTVIDLRVS
jgi:hypothetical protein